MAAPTITSTAPPLQVALGRRRALAWAAGVAALAATTYAVAPSFGELGEAVGRLDEARPWWLGAVLALEALSIAGYVALFRAVYRPHSGRVGWRASYEISLASLGAASKLPAPAGAGSLALVAWALRRAGLPSGAVARGMVAFFAVLYGVYMAALAAGGLGLHLGVLPGESGGPLTLVPALVALVAIAAALALAARRPRADRPRRGRLVATADVVGDGVRTGLALVRARQGGLGGAVAWWTFDALALWAAFAALGAPPAVAVVILAYLIGMAGDLLPLPGGVGGVEGATVAALALLGVQAGPALVAVLIWRLGNFWIPTIPGAAALIGLRRSAARWTAAN